jgi:capsular exopolysaccharide synthesis family protein
MTQTIKGTINQLHSSLREYIEATYHISAPALIELRKELLDRPGVIHQIPYIESTPRYQSGESFSAIKGLQPAALRAYSVLSTPSDGLPALLYDPPYKHQSDAIRHSLVDGKNLLVMTGTGSGKTESFLLPILGKLAHEAHTNPSAFRDQPAMRATALNLAQSLVQRKGRVVIVDGDLRKGSIAKTLGLENSKRISTILTGADKLDDALQVYAAQPDLWVLPSGPVPPNPAELIGSEGMAELCTELAKRFEHVIIDSPPVLAVTDATIMAGLVDGVVLLAESGKTHRAGLMRTRAILENAGARILGVVLNKLDLRREGYYGYGYGYYHYSRYGKYPYGRAASE